MWGPSSWYDACAVMIRRLIETLIIESYEAHSLSVKITNSSGDFFYLSDLISITLSETSWNLSRNAKKSLPKLKDIGDKSAHSRRFNPDYALAMSTGITNCSIFLTMASIQPRFL